MILKTTSKEVNSFQTLIDTYVRWKNFSTRDERTYDYYHPSEWGKCLRDQQYKHYSWMGKIKVSYAELTSQQIRLFDKGHNMHERWRHYFEGMGNVLMGRWKCKNPLCYMFDDDGKMKADAPPSKDVYRQDLRRLYEGPNRGPVFKPDVCACGCPDFEYVETEVFSEELKMKGHADLVVNCEKLDMDLFRGVTITCDKRFLPQKKEKVVIDMKTAGTGPWKNQIMKYGAHASYIIQLTIYIHLLDCAYGLIIYENKDNSELFIHKVERDPDLWEVLQFQAREMVKQRKRGELPPPKAKSKNEMMCKYCEFRTLCHKSAIWEDPNLPTSRRDFYLSTL